MAKRLLAVFGVLMLASACGVTPHEVDITAQAPRAESTIGAGVTIDLQVIDERETTEVGKRSFDVFGADITADNVIQVLEREVVSTFQSHGFNVVAPGSDYDADVEVRLRSFTFALEPGWWTGEETTNIVIAVEAETGGRDFDRTYRAGSKESAMFVPGARAIDDTLSAALSEVLRQLAGDRDLMNFLARQ